MRLYTPCLFILLVCSLLLNTILAAPAVTLTARPYFQFAPGYIRLTLTIERDARNRAYCVIYEGSYSGQTCRQLDGAEAPRTQPLIELKDLPAGKYSAVAKIGRNDGSVISSGTVQWEILDGAAGIP